MAGWRHADAGEQFCLGDIDRFTATTDEPARRHWWVSPARRERQLLSRPSDQPQAAAPHQQQSCRRSTWCWPPARGWAILARKAERRCGPRCRAGCQKRRGYGGAKGMKSSPPLRCRETTGVVKSNLSNCHAAQR